MTAATAIRETADDFDVPTAEAAALLNVSERRARQYARDGLLPYVQLVPRGRVRVRRSDVLKMLELRRCER